MILHNYLNGWKYFANQVSKIVRNIWKNSYFHITSKILNSENVKTFIHNFQKRFIIVPIEKEASNFSFMGKKTAFET